MNLSNPQTTDAIESDAGLRQLLKGMNTFAVRSIALKLGDPKAANTSSKKRGRVSYICAKAKLLFCLSIVGPGDAMSAWRERSTLSKQQQGQEDYMGLLLAIRSVGPRELFAAWRANFILSQQHQMQEDVMGRLRCLGSVTPRDLFAAWRANFILSQQHQFLDKLAAARGPPLGYAMLVAQQKEEHKVCLEDLNEKLRVSDAATTDLTKQVDHLTNELSHCTKKTQEDAADYAQVEQQMDSQVAAINALLVTAEEAIEEEKGAHDETKKALRNAVAAASDAQADEAEFLERMHAREQDSRDQIASQHEENRLLKKEGNRLKEAFKEAMSDSDNNCASLVAQNDRITQAYAEAIAASDGNLARVTDLQTCLQNAEAATTEGAAALAATRAEMKSLVEVNQRLKLARDKAMDTSNGYSARVRGWQDRVKNTQAAAAEDANALATTRAEIQRLKLDLQDRVKNAEDAVTEGAIALAATRAEMESLVEENHRLTQACADTEAAATEASDGNCARVMDLEQRLQNAEAAAAELRAASVAAKAAPEQNDLEEAIAMRVEVLSKEILCLGQENEVFHEENANLRGKLDSATPLAKAEAATLANTEEALQKGIFASFEPTMTSLPETLANTEEALQKGIFASFEPIVTSLPEHDESRALSPSSVCVEAIPISVRRQQDRLDLFKAQCHTGERGETQPSPRSVVSQAGACMPLSGLRAALAPIDGDQARIAYLEASMDKKRQLLAELFQ